MTAEMMGVAGKADIGFVHCNSRLPTQRRHSGYGQLFLISVTFYKQGQYQNNCHTKMKDGQSWTDNYSNCKTS